MKLSQETIAIVSSAVVIGLGIVGMLVQSSLNQTAIDNRLLALEKQLRDDIGASEDRVTERIDQVATGLRTVEGETAPLAGLADRLTEEIKGSETRLRQGLQETEKRLTARIDKIDDRLLDVEGESARPTVS